MLIKCFASLVLLLLPQAYTTFPLAWQSKEWWPMNQADNQCFACFHFALHLNKIPRIFRFGLQMLGAINALAPVCLCLFVLICCYSYYYYYNQLTIEPNHQKPHHHHHRFSLITYHSLRFGAWPDLLPLLNSSPGSAVAGIYYCQIFPSNQNLQAVCSILAGCLCVCVCFVVAAGNSCR